MLLGFDANGVLKRNYYYINNDDFNYCDYAAEDFQYIFDGWNPPPGQVNNVSPRSWVIP